MLVGDENQKESNIIMKDSSVFNIEDMMAPIDDTFDFLNVKTKKEDTVEEIIAKEQDTKGNTFFIIIKMNS